MPLKTEQDHYRELIEAIKLACSAAVALGFYRNQSNWMQVAATLEQMLNIVTRLVNRGVN